MEKKEKWLPFRHFFHVPWMDEDFWDVDFPHHGGPTICEDKERIYVEADLPGLKPEEIEVTFEKGILWIRGERKEEQADQAKKYYRKASRSFAYRVQVPGDVDATQEPDATYKDGVMRVSFTKTKGTQPKKINIKTK